MTTFQMIEKETGAKRPLVMEAKKSIIGNRHTATPQEIHNIIKYIKEHKHGI